MEDKDYFSGFVQTHPGANFLSLGIRIVLLVRETGGRTPSQREVLIRF